MVPPNPILVVSRRRALLSAGVALLYGIAIVILAAARGGGWRTPIAMAAAIDPNLLARYFYNLAHDPLAVLAALGLMAAIYAPIGLALGIGQGPSGRTGRTAALLAFDIAVAEQIVRWIRPGEAPSLSAPLIAVLASVAAWRVGALFYPATPLVRRGGWGRLAIILAAHLMAAGALGVAGVAYGLSTLGMTPSQLATFLLLHGKDHNPTIDDTIQSVATSLLGMDRMHLRTDLPEPAWIGANARFTAPAPAATPQMAESIATLRALLAKARPGDVIELLPGRYDLTQTVAIDRPGTPAQPIVLRAASLGTVEIVSTTIEAFKVYAPNWIVENLVMKGACQHDTDCDHAFHIVGGATNDVFRNLRLEDFNAQFKINAEGAVPDNGRIEHVTLLDTHPRDTASPVTPVDLDAASGWHISDSFIADFARTGGDQVSYGGYAKAAGSGNVFERNLVVCEWHLRTLTGQRIGLSLGGGGSGLDVRRDRGVSGYEQSSSTIRDNLIVSCSDDGIYINRSPDSTVSHNTLVDTGGIDVRFPESTATAGGNLVDGPIRTRDHATLTETANTATGMLDLFRGSHPVRALFESPARLDLRWALTLPSAGDPADSPGLCGARPHAGAFADFAACLRTQ